MATTEPGATRAAGGRAPSALIAVGRARDRQAAGGGPGRGHARRASICSTRARGDPAAHLPRRPIRAERRAARRRAAAARAPGASRCPRSRRCSSRARSSPSWRGRHRARRPAHDRRVRGPRRAVRPAARRGRAPGHAQLDVGAAAGLVLGRAGAPDRRPARGRHPRPAVRHPLRRPAPDGRVRTYFDSAEDLDLVKNQDGVSAQARRGRAAPARPARLPRRGQARHVPLPHASASSGRRRCRRRSTTSTTSSSPIPPRWS